MLITILDLETTGLNPNTDEVIEVGAILYSVEQRAIVQQVSTLFSVDVNAAEDINGISPALAFHAPVQSVDSAMAMIEIMLQRSAYYVAFNSDFDRQWFNGFPSPLPKLTMAWADAAAIRYPRPSNSRSLVALCVAHGVPVVSAHRALDDCRLLAELLGKVPDLDGELARAARPRVLVRAIVSYENRALASNAGFVWDRLVPRAWAKMMPREDIGELPFDVVEVEGNV